VDLLSTVQQSFSNPNIKEIWNDKGGTISDISQIENGETYYAATEHDIDNDTQIVM